MKLLLFDQNISPRLVDILEDLYPGSIHVSMIGLGKALDVEIVQRRKSRQSCERATLRLPH